MDFLIKGLSFALTGAAVGGILYLLSRTGKAQKGVVTMHKGFLPFSLIVTAVFLSFTVASAFATDTIAAPATFFGFSLIGQIFLLAYVNCRISYDERGITCRNLFGVTKYYTYDQVTALERTEQEDCVYLGNARISVTCYQTGREQFINYVCSKYRELHDGQSIPRK